MKGLGLIGYPLSHSFSKKYFSDKFQTEGIAKDWKYELYALESIEELKMLLKNTPNLVGLNVTIPYKEQVLPFLDSIGEGAKAIGAVNTIVIQNGKLKGYNTDVYGFGNSIKPLLLPHHQRALILGTGGASKAVRYALEQLNIEVTYVSRTPAAGQLSYKDLTPDVFKKYQVIVNTSPLGTYPNEDACPAIPYGEITADYLFYDLVYNPSETLFLRQGKAKGAMIKNGLEMLHLQAEKAWAIWNVEIEQKGT